jgi:hypothetical protein
LLREGDDLHSTFLYLLSFFGSSEIYFDFLNTDCLSIATSALTGKVFSIGILDSIVFLSAVSYRRIVS